MVYAIKSSPFFRVDYCLIFILLPTNTIRLQEKDAFRSNMVGNRPETSRVVINLKPSISHEMIGK